jgi:hypothetical protein
MPKKRLAKEEVFVYKREEITAFCKIKRTMEFIILTIHHTLLERFSEGGQNG